MNQEGNIDLPDRLGLLLQGSVLLSLKDSIFSLTTFFIPLNIKICFKVGINLSS